MQSNRKWVAVFLVTLFPVVLYVMKLAKECFEAPGRQSIPTI